MTPGLETSSGEPILSQKDYVFLFAHVGRTKSLPREMRSVFHGRLYGSAWVCGEKLVDEGIFQQRLVNILGVHDRAEFLLAVKGPGVYSKNLSRHFLVAFCFFQDHYGVLVLEFL